MKTYINLSPIRKLIFSLAYLLTVLACVSLSEIIANAQTNASRADIGLHINKHSGTGYPDLNMGVASDVLLKVSRNLALEGQLDYLFRAHKYTGDGSAVALKGQGHGFVTDNLSIDGGVFYRRQHTKAYDKDTFGPLIGASYWFPKGRIAASYERDLKSINSVSALNVEPEYIINQPRYYFAIRPSLSFVWFDQPGRGKLTGYRGGISISIGKRISD